eukprot:m.73519 g.73519  ORF g.73519 m.73519 type:complete len:681 (+) comp24566_c0_seq1:120-2162(+)
MSLANLQRGIIDAFNNPPFAKGFTLIGFDAIEPLQLVQLLQDVMGEITGQDPPINIRDEDPEEMLRRMLKMLQFLKYKPPESSDMGTFRAGLVAGQRDVLYPIFLWLLNNIDGLKVRAYLSKYLVPIKVPPEMLSNSQLAQTHENYLAQIEEFKEVHKEVEGFRKSEFSIVAIKEDIAMMEKEKEQIAKRVERIRRKTERLPHYEEMLQAATLLRIEQEREDQLQRSANEQQTQLEAAEAKHKAANEKLRQMRANSVNGGPEALLARTEEEHRMQKYMDSDKLPKEIEDRQATLQKLEKVVHEPLLSREDLSPLHNQINALTTATNKLIEERMISNNSSGDKQVSMFRQQAAMIARKKESVAEKLFEEQEKLSTKEQELKDKLQDSTEDGPRNLAKGEFKGYVAKLRVTSSEYKQKKADFTVVVSENETLERTMEILEAKSKALQKLVEKMESVRGISGYRQTQETLEEVSVAKGEQDEIKGMSVVEYTEKAKELEEAINSKKLSLQPLIQQLRTFRQERQSVEGEYNEKKELYDKEVKAMDGGKATLEKEVRMYRQEVAREESRYHLLNTMMNMNRAHLARVKTEMQIYVSSSSTSSPDGKKKKSLRDILNEKINKQVTTNKHMQEKHAIVSNSHDQNMRQLDMWRDLTTLMDCKTKVSLEEDTQPTQSMTGEGDRMVF